MKMDTFSAAEAASILGVNHSTFRTWISRYRACKPIQPQKISLDDLLRISIGRPVGRARHERFKMVADVDIKFSDLRQNLIFAEGVKPKLCTNGESGEIVAELLKSVDLVELIRLDVIRDEIRNGLSRLPPKQGRGSLWTITEDKIRNSPLDERSKTVAIGRLIKGRTLQSLGGEFGVSRERIRQIEAKATRALRGRGNEC